MQKLIRACGLCGRYLNNLTVGFIAGLMGGFIYLFSIVGSKLSFVDCVEVDIQNSTVQVGINPADVDIPQLIDNLRNGVPISVPVTFNVSLAPDMLTIAPACVQTIQAPLFWGATTGIVTGGVLTTAYQLFKCQMKKQQAINVTPEDSLIGDIQYEPIIEETIKAEEGDIERVSRTLDSFFC